MITDTQIAVLTLGGAALFFLYRKPLLRYFRASRYERGRKVEKPKRVSKSRDGTEGLSWGDQVISDADATRHFLIAGTTGSGKTHVQRILMERPLLRLPTEPDSRVLIYDAKGDTTPYLKRIGVTAPVYSFHPFEARDNFPQAVSWDAGKDITSPMRALNLAAALHPKEGGGTNQYFVNAARHVSAGVLKSLIKHNAGDWTFSEFIAISLSRSLTMQVLLRDSAGKRIVETYLRDDRTGDDVFSTVCTQLAYFEPVAALWKRSKHSLSIREWLSSNSVLLLGQNSTASAALDVLNAQLFRLFADEVDSLHNSATRRVWVWLEEAREAKGLVDSEALQLLANKGRSRGVCLVLAFQAIEGFHSAAGKENAENLIAQCSHKALLRMESQGSAKWASELLGQLEKIEVFRNDNDQLLAGEGRSEQRVLKDAVLPSEFYTIPDTSKRNGLQGFFVSPGRNPRRVWLSPKVVGEVVVSDADECEHAVRQRAESEQWLPEVGIGEADRLGIELVEKTVSENRKPSKKLRLRSGAAWNDDGLSQVAAIEEGFLLDHYDERLEH